jgi:hypothetical protein
MHDPMTVAFEIKSPFKTEKLALSKKAKKAEKIRPVIITIWHVDPCKDGSDDSCGWFMRARHIDKIKLDKVKREFEFNFKHNYWFNKSGYQKLSTIGIAINMFRSAAWIYFDRDKRKFNKFMRENIHEIMYFAENPIDSLHDAITNKYNESKEERYNPLAGIVYSWICRKMRPWYKHPKWHIHHWKIQLVFLRRFKKKKIKSNIDVNLRATI